MQLTVRNATYYELAQDGEIIGGVFAVDQRTYIEIVDLFVNVAFQGQKYGRSLFRDILNTYPYSIICLRCEAFGNGLEQEELAAWYRRWGFDDGSPFHKGEGWMHRIPGRI